MNLRTYILLAAVTLIMSGQVRGQIDPRATAALDYPQRPSTERIALEAPPTDLRGKALISKASADGISVLIRTDLEAVERGYYLIGGVFRDRENAARLVRKLRDQGLDAGRMTLPDNALSHVFVARYQGGRQALEAVRSQLGGAYPEEMWILGVENKDQAVKVPSSEIQQGVRNQDAGSLWEAQPTARALENLPAGPSGNRPLEKGLKPEYAPNNLIKKANTYFNRMWYSEAAWLYEQAFSRNPEHQNPQTVQKVADAHYFNSNMERARYWYEQLYDLQGDAMDAENLFKYAHALKGSGKYGRARRFLRLRDKELEKGGGLATPAKIRHSAAESLEGLLEAAETYTVRNLDINSKYSDFGPMYYRENQIVFASAVDSAFFKTRRYKWNDQPYLDLYVAQKQEGSDELLGAVKFSKAINTRYHEAAVAFSPDQQTIYFTRNNYGKKLRRDRHGVNHLKIYRSRKTGDTWSEAEELPFNGEDYSTGHPALSPDGKQLYFVSDMPGSRGDTDVFVVDVLEDGSFSKPRNLGPNVNTVHKEMFPYFTGDKLYFSSTGHAGLGGLDVYVSAFDPAGGFLPAQNLGKPINSKKDDFSLIIREEAQKGYFASNRRGGKGDDDLYAFERLPRVEPNRNAIAGVVTDLLSGEALPNAVITLLDADHKPLREIVSNEQGEFVFEELDGHTTYVLRAELAGYQTGESVLKTLENEPVTTQVGMKWLDERIVVEGGVRKLKTNKVFFDFDRYQIRKDAAAELDNLVGIMKEHTSMVIRIESHTDSRGSRAYNKALSERRAKATRDYLLSQGIAPERIAAAVGYGEEKLLNECDGSVRCAPEKHERNRRSEFIIVEM